MRPRFVEIREKKKNESFWWVLKIIFKGGIDYLEEQERKQKISSRLNMIRKANRIESSNIETNEAITDADNKQCRDTSGGYNEIDHIRNGHQRKDIDDGGDDDEDGSVNDHNVKDIYNNTPLLMKSPDELHDNKTSCKDTTSLLVQSLDQFSSQNHDINVLDTNSPLKQEEENNLIIKCFSAIPRRFSSFSPRSEQFFDLETNHSSENEGRRARPSRRASLPPFPYVD